MTRKEFITACGLFGISLPFQSALKACSKDSDAPILPGDFTGNVLIVGAGAAGMAAAYLLQQLGVKYQILEADSSYGGRFRRTNDFADFPIPLGAEWLHVLESELPAIVNDSAVQIATVTQRYAATDTYGFYSNGTLTVEEVGSAINGLIDQKFIGSSWFDFFDKYIVPSIRNKMRFNTQIVSVDYSGDKMIASEANGNQYEADKIVLTVPLKILQLGEIRFSPSLPNNKQLAIANANIWGGIKIFLKFTEKFYPTFLEFDDSETNEGQRTYYDAAYGQNTADNVLGLFAVGKQAEPYQNLSGVAQRDYVLNELDGIFNGKAFETFQDILVQNWNEQPFARGAYLADVASSSTSRIMAESVDDKLYFAGDAYTREDDWSAVHNAARSARDAVRELIR